MSIPISVEMDSLKRRIKEGRASNQNVFELEQRLQSLEERTSQPVPDQPDKYNVGEKVYVPLDEEAFSAFSKARFGLTEVVDSYPHDGKPGRVVKAPQNPNTLWWVDLGVLVRSEHMIEDSGIKTGNKRYKIVPGGDDYLVTTAPFPAPIIVEPGKVYAPTAVVHK